MPTAKRPRHGSLQFWPRKRATKALPRVNWAPISDKAKIEGDCLMGFIGYKVGMSTAFVKDNTEKSMTKGKRVAIPVTILEVPNMKIYSVRFYKNGRVMKDVVVSNDKELKRKIKVSKDVKKFEGIDGFDDVRVLAYSVVKQTGLKKVPDLIELGIKAGDKLDFVKGYIGKEISLDDSLNYELVDVRGLTKGKGFQGTVKRFGIKLRRHKTEKGQRKPGSIGPWHPAHVTFRVPMAGQLGMFTRVHYNLKVIGSGSVKDEGKDINVNGGFKNYGNVRGNYVILAGSVQGPQKRQIIVTPSYRPTKETSKKNFELLGLEGGR